MLIHMSIAKVYRFKGVTFEWHSYCGPIILNRHTENERPFTNISLRNWAAVNKFSTLSAEEKEKHRLN